MITEYETLSIEHWAVSCDIALLILNSTSVYPYIVSLYSCLQEILELITLNEILNPPTKIRSSQNYKRFFERNKQYCNILE